MLLEDDRSDERDGRIVKEDDAESDRDPEHVTVDEGSVGATVIQIGLVAKESVRLREATSGRKIASLVCGMMKETM